MSKIKPPKTREGGIFKNETPYEHIFIHVQPCAPYYQTCYTFESEHKKKLSPNKSRALVVCFLFQFLHSMPITKLFCGHVWTISYLIV